MKHSYLLLIVLILFFPVAVFSQQGASVVRDYVGLINQTYHPGIVSYLEKVKAELIRQNETNAVKNIDIFLSGAFGSGFLFSDRGNFYVITNNHVVAQAHTVSITFERTDGSKRRIDNLRIIATDEVNDLAILALPAGERPLVNHGLTLLTRAIEEGEEVFSAGFPGLGITPIWQFGNGRVSNANVRFPKSLNDDTMMGPFIQHTAPIDFGNSGGPLLVTANNVPSGYAVAGINTLSAIYRQATNYAIPAATVQTFITSALNPRPDTFRTALDERLNSFVRVLNSNRDVYLGISDYISAACIGENAEFAFEEMVRKAGRPVLRTFSQKSEESLISAMGIAIGWTIEDSIRSGGSIRASIKEVTGIGEEYTIIFTINNRDVESIWIREYGNWRIKTFGTVASGDVERLNRRDAERNTYASMRPNSIFGIQVGYAYLFDKAPASLYLAVNLNTFLVNFYYHPDFWNVGFLMGVQFPIPVGQIGLMPYIYLGTFVNFESANVSEEYSFSIQAIEFGALAQGGIKVYTSYVPGLFFDTGFQFNLPFNFLADFGDDDYTKPFTMGLSFSIGYSF
ncbi:MAG: serine protease [Treponema sp.]|nr:serine protease [Treponema sp.]